MHLSTPQSDYSRISRDRPSQVYRPINQNVSLEIVQETERAGGGLESGACARPLMDVNSGLGDEMTSSITPGDKESVLKQQLLTFGIDEISDDQLK